MILASHFSETALMHLSKSGTLAKGFFPLSGSASASRRTIGRSTACALSLGKHHRTWIGTAICSNKQANYQPGLVQAACQGGCSFVFATFFLRPHDHCFDGHCSGLQLCVIGPLLHFLEYGLRIRVAPTNNEPHQVSLTRAFANCSTRSSSTKAWASAGGSIAKGALYYMSSQTHIVCCQTCLLSMKHVGFSTYL